MNNRLVLLADPRDRAELERCGTLPSCVWGDLYDRDRVDEDTTILYADPSFLTDRNFNDKERRGRLGELLNFSFVHLVVIANREGKSVDETMQPGIAQDNLSQLEEWYKTFAEIAGNDVKHRRHEISKILVLIFVDHPPPGCLKRLDAILFSGYKGIEKTGVFGSLLDRCYIMLPELDCGEQTALAAESLWPLYVGRLLARLQAVRPVRENPPRIYAWRAYEIRLPITNEALDAAVRKGTELFTTRLNGGAAPEKPDEIQFEGGRVLGQTSLKLPPALQDSARSWIDFNAPQVARAKTAPSTWANAFGGAHQACALSASTTLAQATPGEAAAQLLWTKIHQSPSMLPHFIGDLTLKSSESVERTAAAAANLDAYLKEWAAWERNCVHLIECAAELDRAQHGYLQAWYRVGLAAAVALAMSVLGCAILKDVISDLNMAITVIGPVVGLGAFGGAIIPWMIERRRGENALDVLRGELAKLDLDARTLNEIGQNLVVDALHSHDILAAQTARARARMLLLRARALIDQSRKPAVGAPGKLPTMALSEGSNFIKKQRADFRRETELFLKRVTEEQTAAGTAVSTPADDAIVAAVVETQWRRFLDRWRAFCETDGSNAGHLPAAALTVLLENTWLRLASELRSETYKRRRDSFQLRENAELWTSTLTKLNAQPFNYYLSCMAAGYELNLDNRRRMLLYRSDLERHLTEPLLTAGISAHARSTMVESLACEALWFQEVPVNLTQNAAGKLTVAST